jgi:ankyrin repeat protein
MFRKQDPQASSRIPNGQDWLKSRMQSLGYELTPGVCAGIGMAALQTACARGPERFYRFYQRLLHIASIDLDQFPDYINNLKKKKCKLIQQCIEKEIHEGFAKLSVQAQARVKSGIQEKINKALKKHERALEFEIDQFLDVVVTQQLIDEAKNLLPKNTPVALQGEDAVIALTLSPTLETKGNITRFDHFTGHYIEKNNLKWYLTSLVEACEETNLKTLVKLSLTNYSHDIFLSYDPVKKTWWYVDAEQLELANPASDISIDTLVSQLGKSLFGTIVSTNIYDRASNSLGVMKFIKTWKNSAKWKKIHEVTKEKVHRLNGHNKSWLEVAVRNNDQQAVSQIFKFHDINKTKRKVGTPLHRELDKILHIAAFCGHDRLVADFLQDKNIKVDAKDKDGSSTPLYYAAYGGHFSIVKQLINKNANVNSQNIKKQTPLYIAAENGQLNIAKYLIKKQADVKLEASEQYTPIYIAALKGHTDIVELLIVHGALNEDAADVPVEKTPLYAAIDKGHRDIVELLIKHKYDAKFKLKPLCCLAAKNGHVGVLKLLLKNVSSNGPNFLKKPGIESANFRMIRFLTKEGIITSDDHLKILQTMIKKNQLESLELFIRENADIDFGKEPYQCLLHLAVKRGHKAIAAFLLAKKAPIDAFDKKQQTPLQLASMYGHIDLVKLLFKEKEKEKEMNAEVINLVFSLALKNNHWNIVEQLKYDYIENLSDQNLNQAFNQSLNQAALNGRLTLVQDLIRGKHVSVKGNEKSLMKAILNAVSQGHEQIVGYIIKKMEENEIEINFGKILCWAAEYGRIDLIKSLFEKDNKNELVTYVNHRDFNPLWLAVKNKHHEVVDFLLDHGAEVEQVPEKQYPPLFIAAITNDDADMVASLLIYGSAKIEKGDVTHPSLLWWAAMKGSKKEIVESLLKNKADPTYRLTISVAKALNLAEKNKFTPQMEQFLANKNSKDMVDITVAEIALLAGHDTIAKLIATHAELKQKKNSASMRTEKNPVMEENSSRKRKRTRKESKGDETAVPSKKARHIDADKDKDKENKENSVRNSDAFFKHKTDPVNIAKKADEPASRFYDKKPSSVDKKIIIADKENIPPNQVKTSGSQCTLFGKPKPFSLHIDEVKAKKMRL